MAATVFFESASEIATLRNVFKVGGVATDPTLISLTITTPSGTATTYTYAAAQITRNGTGDYQKDIQCSEDGEWQYVWTGTTAAQDVESGTWTVFEVDLGHLYCTPAALKSRLGITDSADDYEVHAACFSASRSIEQYCERTFWRSPTGTARTFEPKSMYCVKLPEFNDLVSVSTLATDTSGDGVYDVTWSASDYQLLPYNPSAAPEQRPYTEIRAVGGQVFPTDYSYTRMDRVQVTGVWGWPSVPWSIKQAALILAEETLKLKDAPFGIAGYGEYGMIRVRENPKVRNFAHPYCRNPTDDRGRKVFVA